MWILIPHAIVAGILAVNIGVALYLHGSSPYPFGYWFPFPFFPLFFIPVLFLIFFGFRWFFWGGWWGRGWYGGGYHDQALEILRERYATGEITREQLEQMTRELEQV